MKDEEMAEEYAKAHIVQYPKRKIISENGFCTSEDEVKEAFLAGLKAGRPQWHDLQKDKNDLPDEGTYLVVWQNARGYRDTMIMKYEEDDEEKLHWFDDENDCWDDDVIAWCEIPTFDKE